MNQQLKTFLTVIGAIILAGASLAYGALTAPQAPKPSPSVTPSVTATTAPVKQTPEQQLASDLPTITGVLVAAYPKITTDYTINKGKLYASGEWFGTTLTYKGADTENRDTLRVLLQKKGGIWTLRTTPPEPLLSTKKYPDAPRAVLQDINKAISLP